MTVTSQAKDFPGDYFADFLTLICVRVTACRLYLFCFELQLVIDDLISITIKFKLWISFELKLK